MYDLFILCFWGLPKLVLIVQSFLFLSSISLYRQTLDQSTHKLMYIWIFFWGLVIMKHYCKHSHVCFLWTCFYFSWINTLCLCGLAGSCDKCYVQALQKLPNFFKVVLSLYLFTSSVWEFQLLHILANN